MAESIRFEQLRSTAQFQLRRGGRFLVAELLVPHRILSTSTCNGGQSDTIRFLVNHQSCEGSDHWERHSVMVDRGLDHYHEEACRDIELPPESVALMGTAANMNYAAISEHSNEEVSVVAVVTAGVQGNATCAGDRASWRETEAGWSKIPSYAGTINTMVLVSRPLTEGALARAAMTATEGKSAALQQLAVRSLYSHDLATGTGTDQYCLAAPLEGAKPLTATSTHVELGEFIASAVRDATLEALRWQNGLEPSYTRSLLHALGRYGFANEDQFYAALRAHLTERQLELLQKNSKSILYEPLVAASVYAYIAVLDRIRYGTLPASVVAAALRQQAASVAANLAAQPERWQEFHRMLTEVDSSAPVALLVESLALGWSAKWT